MLTTLAIEGMTCEGCVKTLTRVLNAVPGVDHVDISLAQAQAVINHDDRVTTQILINTISDAGFDAQVK